MDKEQKLKAEETIMEAACNLCHWPFLFEDEEAMYEAKCGHCPIEAAVESVLDRIPEKEETV